MIRLSKPRGPHPTMVKSPEALRTARPSPLGRELSYSLRKTLPQHPDMHPQPLVPFLAQFDIF